MLIFVRGIVARPASSLVEKRRILGWRCDLLSRAYETDSRSSGLQLRLLCINKFDNASL
jgi:hypothetical protein